MKSFALREALSHSYVKDMTIETSIIESIYSTDFEWIS